MKKFRSKFNLMITAFLILSLFTAGITANARTIIPQIKYVKYPGTSYTAGDRISFAVQAPNYSGKVEYRLVLWNCTKKTYTNIWNKSNGHPNYYYVKSSGKTVFTIGFVIKDPGKYKIIVYVRRAGISPTRAAIKSAGCDSYRESAPFTIKPKVQPYVVNVW